jgi:ribosome-binding factor A
VLIEGDDAEIREAMKALHSAEKFVRQQVASEFEYSPRAAHSFRPRHGGRKAGRIDRILEELKREKEKDEG